jgi:prophage maintenance system killer protein
MRPSSQGPSLAFPDYHQAVAFHESLMQRLGRPQSAVDENKLRQALERAQMVTQQRGDIIAVAAFLLFGLIRDQPFGTDSTEAGLALTLAFLLRHGVGVEAPDEELAGISLGISEGEVYAGMVEMWLREYAIPTMW